MNKILYIFLPIIFLYDLILSKFSRYHRISHKSYILMRYLYKYSDGIILFLISFFLKGFKSKLPSSASKTYSKHKILDSLASDKILKSVFNSPIINDSIYGEKLKFSSYNKDLDYNYYKEKSLIRLDFSPQTLIENKFISEFATNPYWVNEVKKILGTKPYFVGIDAWLTLPPHKKMSNYDEIGSHVSSQMWHRDCDNLRDIKVMTYLTDVKNLDEGPFEIINGTNKFLFFNPYRYLMGSAMRVENEYVQKKFKNSIYSFLGEKGETMIADTRALHRGRTIVNQNSYRVMIQLYFSNHIFGKVKFLNIPSKHSESYEIWKKSFSRTDCYYDSLFNS